MLNVPAQWKHEDGFLRDAGSMMAIHPSSSGSFSNTNPVGSTIAGSEESKRIDESLQEHRLVAIMLGPVVDDLAGGARQNGRCQSLHAHPRQNQEAAVVDDILQVPSALGRVPTNPLIAGGHRPGWTRPLKASEYLTRSGLEEVA